MEINGTNISTYGLILINKEGFYNMPPRVGETFYDWGDETEHLIATQDINFFSLTFKVNFYFDQRLTANTLTQTIDFLKSLGTFSLKIDEAVGSLGTYNVELINSSNNRNYKTGSKISLEFYHRTPIFNGVLPSLPTTLNSQINFGGYNFGQFNIAVSSVEGSNGVGELKFSTNTTEFGVQKMGSFREIRKIILECYLVGADRTELLTKMESFKKLVSSSGQKTLNYKGRAIQTYCSDGFVVLQFKRHLKFNLNLNIIE